MATSSPLDQEDPQVSSTSFTPRPSILSGKRPDSCSDKDNNVWVERKTADGLSVFVNLVTMGRFVGEPPTGASIVLYQEDLTGEMDGIPQWIRAYGQQPVTEQELDRAAVPVPTLQDKARTEQLRNQLGDGNEVASV